MLVGFTKGRSTTSLASKLTPNPYQYPANTLRKFEREGIVLQADISDYIGHYLYFGFIDQSQEALFELCRKNDYVLDIGTNIGYSLLRMASLAPRGKVVGFEPDPINYKSCLTNLALNGNPDNVQVFNMGLGESVMEAEIEVRTPGNRGANRIATSSTAAAKVAISRLDIIFTDIKWHQLNLIKIDVEGYELKVLRGGEATLRRYYPDLFIEVNDPNLVHQGDSAKSLILFLFSIGYTNIQNAITKQPIFADTELANQHLDIIAINKGSQL